MGGWAAHKPVPGNRFGWRAGMVPEGDVRTREGGGGNDNSGNKRTGLGMGLAAMAIERHDKKVCVLCENCGETTAAFEGEKKKKVAEELEIGVEGATATTRSRMTQLTPTLPSASRRSPPRPRDRLSSWSLARAFMSLASDDTVDPGLVPEYSLVKLRMRHKRDADGEVVRSVHLRALGSSKILNLRPNLELTRPVPLFYADRDNYGGVTVTPTDHVEDMGVPHQDEDTMAAITVSHHPDTGALLLVSAAATTRELLGRLGQGIVG
ncbi:hypothetical protein E2C01_016537 [Portunus trituberculatus]|uniref:Uncharacterized protein n=1 Tax=Portunus trituberculatus TaxID=210409 RepID=A0A5B7DRC2_PORTR|nr:hypothetical protein [Portunus trituberculatus]